MKCLSQSESQVWLARSGTSITTSRDLLLPYTSQKGHGIFAAIPENGQKIAHLANALAKWAPEDKERFLWLKYWETTPAFEAQFFEHVIHNKKQLIDAPGYLFEPNLHEGTDGETNRTDTAIITGLLLLIMCFDWEAYLVSAEKADCVYVSDQHVMFMSTRGERLQQGERIFEDYGISVKYPLSLR